MCRQTIRALPLLLIPSLPLLHAQEPRSAPAPAVLSLQQEFVQCAKRVFPSVVCVQSFVRVSGEDADGERGVSGSRDAGSSPSRTGWIAAPSSERDYPGFRPHGQGSGFFVSEGDVLTALAPLRVGEERVADLIEVETMDGQRILTDVVGIEPTLGLAVLRCAVFPSWARPSMKPLQFADSDAAEVGGIVLGAGDPAGPERFLGHGLLVAKPSRDCYQELMSATYMQATMFVPPGAYGGPLVDLHGDVLGILMPFEVEGIVGGSTPGSAWALPSKIVSGLYASISEAGTTQSPWLGFAVITRAEIATTRGLPALQAMKKPAHGIMLENVFAPSPASDAGIQVGDWLTYVDGVEIHTAVGFQRQLYLAGVGRTVELRLFRDGETFAREIVVAKRPAEAKPK